MEEMDALEMLEEIDSEEALLRLQFPDWSDDDIFEEMESREWKKIERQILDRKMGKAGF